MPDKYPQADFCIAIDFERGADDPTRVFRTMAELIDAFVGLDRTLIQSVDIEVQPVLLLEDIEAGSLKAWLRTALEAVPDKGLEEADWKKAVGHYLKKGKYFLLDWTKGKTSVTDRKELLKLSEGLHALAEETQVDELSAYAPISAKQLVVEMQKIGGALSHLREGDSARYISDESEVSFNVEFDIAPATVEDILTKQKLTNDIDCILQVKKPDYLGESQWDFRYDGRAIHAKIEHYEWLESFQNRQVDVRPGDGLQVKLRTEVSYGYENEVVTTHYFVLKVIAVIPPESIVQQSLLPPSD